MEALLNLLSSLYPDVDFEFSDSLIDDEILDLGDMDELLDQIYEEFDVRIPEEEVTAENFESADTIFNLIQRLSEE